MLSFRTLILSCWGGVLMAFRENAIRAYFRGKPQRTRETKLNINMDRASRKVMGLGDRGTSICADNMSTQIFIYIKSYSIILIPITSHSIMQARCFRVKKK